MNCEIHDFTRRRPGRTGALGSLALLLSTAAIPGSARAQAQADQPPASVQVEEVIVTAEKRSENLQKVPIAVTALPAARLEAANIQSTTDLAFVTPGMVGNPPTAASGFQLPYIRGVGSSSTLVTIDSSVATYIDGVYQPNKSANIFNLNGIDGIEVLKGPQGTLFGRNATGGAINITTKLPSDTFGFDAEGSYGNYDQSTEKAYITGPLAKGLSANLSVRADQGGDYITNVRDGSKYGGDDELIVNGKLKWDPTDRLDIVAGVLYVHRRSSSSQSNITLFPGSFAAGPASYTDYQSNLSFNPAYKVEQTQASLHARYSFDHFDVVSITGAAFAHTATYFDYDTTAADVFSFNDFDRARTYSEELQVVSTGESRLKWIAGLYFLDDQEDYRPLDLLFIAPAPVAVNSQGNTKAQAVFGQGTYDLGARTRLTLGLRYSHETRKFDGTETIPDFGVTLAGPVSLRKSFSSVTWRASLDHDFTDDIMGYVSYNRGFKSGGFNLTVVDPNQKAVNPEQLDAYEGGLKTRWLDRRVQLNLAAYYYKYKNIQVQRVDPSQGGAAILEAAGAADLYGLDADLELVVTEALHLRGGLAVEHSEYTKYDNASGYTFVQTGAGIAGASTVFDSAAGQRVLNVPNISYNLGADYTVQLPNESSIVASGNYGYTGGYKEVIGDGNFVKGYGLLNATLTWYAPGHRYYVRLWGRNLTNVHLIGGVLINLNYQKVLQEPVTGGIALGVHF